MKIRVYCYPDHEFTYDEVAHWSVDEKGYLNIFQKKHNAPGHEVIATFRQGFWEYVEKLVLVATEESIVRD